MNEESLRALRVGIIGNLLAVAAATLVFREPPGTAIRPMDIPMYLFLIAFGTAIVGLPSATSGLLKDARRFAAWVAGGLCLAPLFVGVFAFHTLVILFKYELKP